MRILITGATGFVGSHMVEYLLSELSTPLEIFAIKRWRSPLDNVQSFINNINVRFIEADLLDRTSLSKALMISRPDYILHFAAQSFPETSFITPVVTLTTNIIGTTNLLEEIKSYKDRGLIDPIILSVSSSEVYGMPDESELPIKESNYIRAANPYSISKVGHDLMSQYYHKAYGLKIIITRMFSHEGPRRGKIFALSSFAYQMVQYEKDTTQRPPYRIFVGNLNSLRTYAHVYDAVRAYWLVVTKGKFGEIYNIGGTHTCTVGDALEAILSKSIFERNTFDIIVDSAKLRPTDITLQVPDCSKFMKETGWRPEKTFDDIITDIVNYWRISL